MEITVILQFLAAVAQLLPEIEAVIPVVEKIINGETASETDAAAVYAAIQTLVASREPLHYALVVDHRRGAEHNPPDIERNGNGA